MQTAEEMEGLLYVLNCKSKASVATNLYGQEHSHKELIDKRVSNNIDEKLKMAYLHVTS